MDLTLRQRHLLRILASFQRDNRLPPRHKVLAHMLGVLVGNDVVVCIILRELQELGLISGAPSNGDRTTHHVRVTDFGFVTVDADLGGLDLPTPPPVAVLPRAIRVTELRFRCIECSAVVVNTAKGCPMCRALAERPSAVWFEPNRKAC